MRTACFLLVGFVLLPGSAFAQALLNLRAGFTPDPQMVAIKAGGNVEVDEGECDYGYVAESGGMVVEYAAGSLPLHVYVESDIDTMLLIRTPSGEFVCDDDSHGSLNPLVTVSDPESGTYVVLVGGYTQNEYRDATVYVTELTPDGASSSSSSEGRPDLSLDPTYGRVTLSSGFTPDPHTQSISAGGSLDVELPGCSYGYVATAPDYNVSYSGSGDLYFFVRADEDTTLLINRPDASWVCDDDSLGDSNPVITIRDAPSGLYNIWVGTYSDDGLVSATLHISGKAAK